MGYGHCNISPGVAVVLCVDVDCLALVRPQNEYQEMELHRVITTNGDRVVVRGGLTCHVCWASLGWRRVVVSDRLAVVYTDNVSPSPDIIMTIQGAAK